MTKSESRPRNDTTLSIAPYETESGHRDPRYRAALTVSAFLNLAMVFIEGGIGWWIGSAALIADAADFMEDTGLYTLALLATAWSPRRRAGAGMIQAGAMLGVAGMAVYQIIERLITGGFPMPLPMALTALLALAVNAYAAWRLAPFETGDASMRAIWLSTRNDALLNAVTLIAAGLVAWTATGWPDLVAGALVVTINVWAAKEVIELALREWRMHTPK